MPKWAIERGAAWKTRRGFIEPRGETVEAESAAAAAALVATWWGKGELLWLWTGPQEVRAVIGAARIKVHFVGGEAKPVPVGDNAQLLFIVRPAV